MIRTTRTYTFEKTKQLLPSTLSQELRLGSGKRSHLHQNTESASKKDKTLTQTVNLVHDASPSEHLERHGSLAAVNKAEAFWFALREKAQVPR
jgi:hypothetical protein